MLKTEKKESRPWLLVELQPLQRPCCLMNDVKSLGARLLDLTVRSGVPLKAQWVYLYGAACAVWHYGKGHLATVTAEESVMHNHNAADWNIYHTAGPACMTVDMHGLQWIYTCLHIDRIFIDALQASMVRLSSVDCPSVCPSVTDLPWLNGLGRHFLHE